MKERKSYLDYLRIFATFGVVMIHMASKNWFLDPLNSGAWYADNVYGGLSRFAVPVFVMISGALFLGRDIEVKPLFGKYILRMITAFVFWSILYGYEYKEELKGYITGHYHMWFVLMIAGLYVCQPIFRKIVTDEKLVKYYLVASGIIAVVIPTISHLLVDFIKGTTGLVVELLRGDFTIMGLNSLLGYGFYFVLGYYLSTVEISKKKRVLIYILGILGGLSTIFLTMILSRREGTQLSYYYDFFLGNVCLEATAIFVAFRYIPWKKKESGKVLAYCSKSTFGAYLVHILIVDRVPIVGQPVYSIPLLSLKVFVIAMAISLVLNGIPLIKKYIV